MALTAYVDDSGSEPTARLYVLGGVALPASFWCDSFLEAWAGGLKSEPAIPYFKASEVWDYKKGPFQCLTTRQREDKVDALSEVLCELHPLAISCSVRWEDFQRFKETVPLPEQCADPFFFLFYRLLVLMIQISQRYGNPAPVDFIFDEQNKAWDQAKAWYPNLRRWLPMEMVPYLGKDPKKGDEKECLPLQAADMFAWYARRDALSSLQRQWHHDIKTRLNRCHTSVELDEGILAGMARDFGMSG